MENDKSIERNGEMTYTYIQYKNEFIKRHNDAEWTVHTSPMDEYGQYYKMYTFTDGATLTEVNRPVYREVEAEAEVEGIKVKIRDMVKLFETEAWNTDEPMSVKFYEEW